MARFAGRDFTVGETAVALAIVRCSEQIGVGIALAFVLTIDIALAFAFTLNIARLTVRSSVEGNGRITLRFARLTQQISCETRLWVWSIVFLRSERINIELALAFAVSLLYFISVTVWSGLAI